MSKRSRYVLSLAAGLLLLALLPGCRMNEAVYHPDGSRIIYARPPLMRVVDQLDERHMSVQTVVARLNVTLRDNEKDKSYELEGIYLGDKDGNMRLHITATTHQLILDMSEHNGITEIWLPRKDRYFKGKREDLLNNSQCELALLAHVGHARDLFFPRAWTPSAIERRFTYEHGREIVSVIEKPNFIRRRSRRVTIAPESAVVEAVEVYDKFGREVGLVGYSNYEFPDEAGDENQLGKLGMGHPNRIVLRSHDNRHTLEMDVDQIDINCLVDDDKFEVPLPEDVKPQDLGSALKRSGNLWE